jgi:hypothetical protein
MASSQSPSQSVADPAAFASAVPAGGAVGFATFLLSTWSAQSAMRSLQWHERHTDTLEIICLGDLMIVEQVLHD